jgi:hypothetical protein
VASKKPLLARCPARFPFVPATGRINRFFVFLGAADFYSLRRGAARKTAMFLAKIIYIPATNEAPSHRNPRQQTARRA